MGKRELLINLLFYFREGEEWHKQRLPISKFIMMPRKMAEYHKPFNRVVQEYIDYLRTRRDRDGLVADIPASLNKWSLECKLSVVECFVAI